MDGTTLRAAMSQGGWSPLSQARYDQLAGPCTAALKQAQCATIRRAAMFLAMVGEETGGLRWTEEIADGSAYNWRADLGNTQAGDGPRFKGRSFIQVTGRTHYGNLSRWAHQQGYVPSSDFFLRDPPALARDAYAFLGPVWYWTVARPQLNGLADSLNIYDATLAVNGGLNGLADRTARWHTCLDLGMRLMPAERAPAAAATAIRPPSAPARTVAPVTPAPPIPPPSGAEMARIVKDHKTGRRYLLAGAQRPLYVSAGQAAEFAALWGLATAFPTVLHQQLVDYDDLIRLGAHGVPAK